MRKKLILCCLVVLLMGVAALLVPLSIVQSAPTFAATRVAQATPIPGATATSDAANTALSEAQNTLNIITVFATILGVVLTLFSVIVIGLAFAGINSYREVQATIKTLRNSVAETQTQSANTRQALVYLGLADRLFNQNSMAEALDTYKKVGSLLPKDAQVQYTLGRIYSGAGDYLSAIAAFEASLSVTAHAEDSVEQAKVQKELGLAYRRKWESLHDDDALKKALQCLQQSLTLNPKDSDTLAILGGLYRRTGDYQQARDYYLRAWRMNPALSYPVGNLASLCWRLGEVKDALTYFGYTESAARERIKRGESEGVWDYCDLALAQLALGNLAEAKQTYQRAIQETKHVTTLDGVLSNLHMLQQSPQPMHGLDEVVQMIEDARNRI